MWKKYPQQLCKEKVEVAFCLQVSKHEPLISGFGFYFLCNFEQLTKPL